jgi:hypothetical protein
MSESIHFDLIKNSVQLDGKGYADSALAALAFRGSYGISRVIVVIVHDKVTVVQLGSLARLLGLATTLGAGLFSRRADVLVAFAARVEGEGFRRGGRGLKEALPDRKVSGGSQRDRLLRRSTTSGSVGDTHGKRRG